MNNGRWMNAAIQGIHLNLDCCTKPRLETVASRSRDSTPSSSAGETEKTEGWVGASRSVMGEKECPISRALCGASARVNTDTVSRSSAM